jgi:hypothetical protein
MILNYALFTIFIALQYGDFWTTYNLIKTDKGHEGNPFMAWIFSKIGVIKGFAVVKFIVILLIGSIVYKNASIAINIFLVAANLFYSYVVYNNYKILKG